MIAGIPEQGKLQSAGATAAPATDVGDPRISSDFDAFLRLMTAQMRNQDPLDPLDGSAFVAQLAQFSALEQQVKTNDRLDALLAALTRSEAEIALGFLGRIVETASGRVELSDAQLVEFGFRTEGAVAKAQAVVTDEQGQEIRRFTVDVDGPGRHEAVWDGQDSIGLPAPTGIYLIKILLYDDRGEKVIAEVPALTRAQVVEARLGDDGGTLILSNGAQTSPADLTAIAA